MLLNVLIVRGCETYDNGSFNYAVFWDVTRLDFFTMDVYLHLTQICSEHQAPSPLAIAVYRAGRD